MPTNVKERLPVSVQLVGAAIFGAFPLVGALPSNAFGSNAWVIGVGLVGALVMVLIQIAIMRRRSLDRS